MSPHPIPARAFEDRQDDIDSALRDAEALGVTRLLSDTYVVGGHAYTSFAEASRRGGACTRDASTNDTPQSANATLLYGTDAPGGLPAPDLVDDPLTVRLSLAGCFNSIACARLPRKRPGAQDSRGERGKNAQLRRSERYWRVRRSETREARAQREPAEQQNAYRFAEDQRDKDRNCAGRECPLLGMCKAWRKRPRWAHSRHSHSNPDSTMSPVSDFAAAARWRIGRPGSYGHSARRNSDRSCCAPSLLAECSIQGFSIGRDDTSSSGIAAS